MRRSKMSYLLISAILISYIISGCSTSSPNTPTTPTADPTTSTPTATTPTTAANTDSTDSKEVGNTSGNIANGGFVAQQGDWVYYCNPVEKLYKVKEDGTGNTLIPISDDVPRYLNVVGDWIYYLNVSELTTDFRKIMKVKTDGTGRTIITDDTAECVNVVGEWIFYSNISDSGKLYKIQTDGMNKTLISNDVTWKLSVAGDWIYYINKSEGEKISRVKTDGTGRTLLSDQAAFNIIVEGDWVYYNYPENFNVYKVKTDGTGRILVSDTNASRLNAARDWIYYFANDKLYRVKTDGMSTTLLSDTIYIGAISIAGDWIYAQDYNADNRFIKMKTDGTGGVLAVLSSENTDDQPITVNSISSMAAKSDALIGEFNKTYYYSGGFSIRITSIKALDEYTYGKNHETNVILIEFEGDVEYSHRLNFGLADQDGNPVRGDGSEIGTVSSIAFSYSDSKLADFVKYILISGLDPNKNNGKTSVVFEVIR